MAELLPSHSPSDDFEEHPSPGAGQQGARLPCLAAVGERKFVKGTPTNAAHLGRRDGWRRQDILNTDALSLQLGALIDDVRGLEL